MAIDIVRATAADADTIVRIICELAALSGGKAAVDSEYVGRYLAFPGRTVLLAETAGEHVGLLAYSLDPNLYHAADGCLIEDLYVRPAWRGRGVGRALVAHVMAEAAKQGWAEVSVSTDRDNRAALSLYRGMGLVEEYVLLEKHFPPIARGPEALPRRSPQGRE
jgi:ribosomal protein S18 acetylase RimI-like enzyme